MSKKIYELLDKAIDNLKAGGLFKPEFVMSSPQGRHIKIGNKKLLNFGSGDFLGLANHERIQQAAIKAVQEYGSGMAAPRVATGTLKIHQDLEEELAKFFDKEAALIFTSGYAANFGIFESLFTDQDYLFCDIYAHPSIVDGLYKTQAQKMFYLRNILEDLEDQLKRSPRARFRMIVAEGVYALDGQLGQLEELCGLAKEYDALVMLQDSLGVGVLGAGGRGTAEHCGVLDKIDIITGNFGEALSGIDLGYIVGPKNIINWLKQNSKPYSYSPSPSPMSAAAALEAIKFVSEMKDQRDVLDVSTQMLRTALSHMGYTVVKSPHPITAVVTYDAVKTQKLVDALYEDGYFVLGLCYPIVPKGFARVRLNVSLSHTEEDLKNLSKAFENQGQAQKILKKN